MNNARKYIVHKETVCPIIRKEKLFLSFFLLETTTIFSTNFTFDNVVKISILDKINKIQFLL